MKGDLHQRARVMAGAQRELNVQPVREKVDFDCLNRLSAYAAQRRAEMGEEKWGAQ